MLIDSHAHLTDEKLSLLTHELINEARTDDINKIITIGTTISDSENAISLANSFDEVFCCVGVYPDEMPTAPVQDITENLSALAIKPKVVGIGETGIDISNGVAMPSLARQQELFEAHIKLALDQKLPIVIHNRNADEIVMEILCKYKNTSLQGVFHCFTSSWDYAKQVLDLGFYISFSGIITYPSGINLLETVKNVPIDRFLIETDAPYLAPIPFRKEINRPKYVKITGQKVADTKQISFKQAQNYAYENTLRLFSKMT